MPNTNLETSMAQRTKPRSVIFSCSLSKTAIDKEMNVKGELLQRWSGGQGGSRFWVQIKYKGKVYPMTCRSRPGRKYKKWVLTNRWLKLVRENELKEGHEVTIFEPDKDGGDFLMVDGLVSPALMDSGLVYAAETLLKLNSALPAAPKRAMMIDPNSTPTTEMWDLNATPTASG